MIFGIFGNDHFSNVYDTNYHLEIAYLFKVVRFSFARSQTVSTQSKPYHSLLTLPVIKT